MNHVYKFVKWDIPELDTLSNTNVYKCMEKLNGGEQLSREEKDSLRLDKGCISLMGYVFNFYEFCKLYLVKDKEYGWQEVYGFDKTSIRATYAGRQSDILRIVEIPKY